MAARFGGKEVLIFTDHSSQRLSWLPEVAKVNANDLFAIEVSVRLVSNIHSFRLSSIRCATGICVREA